MARARIRLDHGGIGEILKSDEVGSLMRDLAEQVAANIEATATWQRHGDKGHIEVAQYVTDRAAAAVIVAHPGALGMQAKHGAITGAAGAAGLEVRERG